MFRRAFQIVLAAALLLPTLAAADPIALKLSFFTSDRSNIYQFSVKPFVDAVNAEGKGLIEIKVYFSGTLGTSKDLQGSLVKDGTVDMALIVPGYAPNDFPDSGVIELPGLYDNAREASHVFTQLTGRGALRGYEEFFVVGAFISQGESIHSRKPLNSLAQLADQTIRTNNRIETKTLHKLGAIPAVIPINQVTNAISEGRIDGATVPPAMLFEFGIGRVTSHHYMIHLGGAPTALVMNRKKFESLPPKAQAIIRKYSGEWLSQRSADAFAVKNRQVLKQLEADPRRTVVFPSKADRAVSQRLFEEVIENWASSDPRHRALLSMARQEIAKYRSAN